MDSEGYLFDKVKFEKMKAMEKYIRFKKLKKLLLVLEVLVVLTMISWSSTYLPLALKVSGSFFIQIADYLCKPHVVFLIGNAIVVALVVLCRENDAGNHYSSGQFYGDYIHHSQDQQKRNAVLVPEVEKSSPTSPLTENMAATGIIDAEEKQMVCVAPAEEKLMKDVEEDKKVEEKSPAVAVEETTKVIQKIQRTRSARVKKEFPTAAAAPSLELRRSKTCRQSAATSFESVDSLSNEEFNLTVAAFIKRHQESLKQELKENEEL